jgi:CDP-diacylglycerol--glycerol-3-phosphate 3-phosphatidyltransferase/cardiolipin synthase
MNTPNILTLLRIALIPILIISFYVPWDGKNIATTGIFAVAALTDWFDGHLARRWNQTTALGAFLDPVADKLIVAVALVLLVEQNPTPWMAIPAAVIIGREITISALREWMAELGERAAVGVSMIGKIKTTAQMCALLMLLYGEAFLELGFICLYIAAILTLWSMILYLKAAMPILLKADD